MRIELKPPIKPQVGDKRCYVKFAWLPVAIGNTIVWLERYNLTKILEVIEFTPSLTSWPETRITWVKYRSLYDPKKST